MKRVGFAVVVFLLAGCSSESWDSATSLFDAGAADAAAPVPVSSPSDAAPAPNDNSIFCKGYAESQAAEAAERGASKAQQEQLAQTDFAQCMAKSEHRLD